MADRVSIEETNKIRKAIGLPPLPVPGAAAATGPAFKETSSDESSDDEEPASTLQTREAAGYTNWQKLRDEEKAKKARDERIAAIKRAKDAAQRFSKLEGKGLGDEDENDLDTRAWLMGQKKRQKKIEKERAKKMEEELAERERLAATEYSSKDLAGVRVAHEVGEFDEESGEQVLTLKDTTIDENEEDGDELENISLREKDKLSERLELKKRKPVYDPNAMDENGERKILSQYDEEIDGKKRKRFTLDGMGATQEEREAKRQEVGERLKAQPISLDILRDAPKSDYMDISEIKIKKPKKTKTKKTRQKAAEEDEDIFPQPTINGADANGDSMDVDTPAAVSKPISKSVETSLVDDEDLQLALARQRKEAFKKRKRLRPEDLARELREEDSAMPGDMDVDGNEVEQPGLIIDETSEFVSNLQKPSLSEQKPRETIQPSIERPDQAKSPSPAEQDADVKMEQTYNDVEDEEELLARLKREQSTNTPEIGTTGLDEESELGQGLGSALNLLKQRGLVKTADMGDINALHRDRQRFLAEKQRREAEAERRARLQRERDRTSGKFDRMSAREREEYSRQFNKQRDQEESRKLADVFNREYKPDVQLKYVDEYGRSMSQKEAFKSLSHDFHGKGSGKQKTEKKLKKIEEERKREAASFLDSSQATGYNNAQGATAKKNRQAGVRLG
ncbi:putative dna binding protein sart-1 [Phaeomoniella chlamydospora]|uniref:Putative dna binding protein sart-1 n=1 Tax=Phaeomoniella chlamydospora TaxID=158046 RepID=A0A0G2F3N7_PHACM|nr:putative dna binding protein sart-1 [Phaeomoniella chlamydospora]